MSTIATGTFKKVSYAKEGDSITAPTSYGVIPTRAAGEGLLSPATITTTGYSAGVFSSATIVASLTVTGLLVVGQKFSIGVDVFTVSAVATNASGNTTAFTLTSLNGTVTLAASGAAVTMLTSTAAAVLTTAANTANTAPTSLTTVATVTGLLGDTDLTIASYSGVIPVGQTFTISALASSPVFRVLSSTAISTSTTATIVTPPLPAAVTTATISFMSGATSKYTRRITSNVDLKKASFKSNELRQSLQRSDFRHGGKSVDGAISGELSGSSYSDFFASILRAPFVAPTTPTLTLTSSASESLVGITITGTFTNLKVGSIVKVTTAGTGWGSTLLNKLLVVVAVNTGATQATFRIANSNDNLTSLLTGVGGMVLSTTLVGKTSFIPSSGHTNDSYTIQHEFTDINQYEVFTGCRITQASIKAPASGLVTCDWSVMGQNMTTATSTLLGTPTAAATTSVFSSAVGSIYLASVDKSLLVTAFDITINNNGSKADCVGSDITPDVFGGASDVSGNCSVFFTDAVIRDKFIHEVEMPIVFVLATGSTSDTSVDQAASIFVVVLPRVKLTGATKDDSEKGLTMTTPYTAIEGTGANGYNATTIQIFDSTL